MESITYTFDKIEYNINIGHNSHNNWKIIDLAKKTDVWFHTENGASSHVILESILPIKDIPRQVLKRCCCLCKTYSKSKSVTKCPIVYTTIDNIVKTDIIGQVISKNTHKIII